MSRAIFLTLVLSVSAACADEALGPDALVITAVDISPSGPVTDSAVVTAHARNAALGTIRVSKCFGLDLEVRNADGELVWRRYEGAVLAYCAPGHVEIGPHEQRTWSATWLLVDQQDIPVPPGSYRLIAVLRELTLADEREARSEPVSVDVQ